MKTVKPSYNRFVLPSMIFADIMYVGNTRVVVFLLTFFVQYSGSWS